MHFFLRTLRTALRALQRNVLRSALTTLGIIIGVAAVIAMVEIGQGSSKAVQETIKRLGANTIIVQPGNAVTGGVSLGAGSVVTLTPEDAEAMARDCASVDSVAPVVYARTQVVYGNRNCVPYFIYGTTPEFLVVRDWDDLTEGQSFQDEDVRYGNKVCLIGTSVIEALFPDEPPVGKEIRIQNVPFKVIGVLSPKGANMSGRDQDDTIIAPWTTIKARVSNASLANTNQSTSLKTDSMQQVNSLNQLYPSVVNGLYPLPSAAQQADTPQPVRFANVDAIQVRAVSVEAIPDAMIEVAQLLRERHRTPADQQGDFLIRDMTETTRAMGSSAAVMARLLMCVACISLVVGGVGIMNIMLVSVTERTREIGLRMAVGARARDILRQFLIEAIVLCLMGGAVGIICGRGGSLLVNRFLHWPVEPSLPAILAAAGVSLAVGIVFGYYPAWKASRLDPIEALRYD
jgi:ABC-type antimicrobial peptide transport system permease subunit